MYDPNRPDQYQDNDFADDEVVDGKYSTGSLLAILAASLLIPLVGLIIGGISMQSKARRAQGAVILLVGLACAGAATCYVVYSSISAAADPGAELLKRMEQSRKNPGTGIPEALEAYRK